MLPPNSSPFDSATRELLPAFRDAYLRGELPAEQSQAVEQYLKSDAVQRGVALARWHQLAEAHQGPALNPPAWVRQQLARQVSVSAVGPLRRPVVRLALGIVLVLSGTATVQWIRQKPLVPEPVQQSIQYAAKSVQEVTEKIVAMVPVSATEPAEQAEVAKPARPKQWRNAKLAVKPAKPQSQAQPERQISVIEQIKPAQPSLVNLEEKELMPENVPAAEPAAVASAEPAAAAAPAASPAPAGPRTVISGKVRDERGQPLIGATVFVKGTRLGTSTDAKGAYRLEVPAGSPLEFGYAGYADKQVAQNGEVLNVTLEPQSAGRRGAARKAARAGQL